MEIYKEIPGYTDYQISDLGNVKSLDRIIKSSPGQRGKYRKLKGKVLRPFLMGKYLAVDLAGKTFYIHQLVAMAFHGHISDAMNKIINHQDVNKLNNRADNLEITTQRENCDHSHLKTSSKHKGVSWSKAAKKWQAQIYINGDRLYLGLFEHEDEATESYENALNSIS